MLQKHILLFVLLSSLVLYVAGVGTGWLIGQTYYSSAEEKLNQLESQMKDLRSVSSTPDLCQYAEARYYLLLSSLKYFELPYRLEGARVDEGTLDRYMQVEAEAFITGQILATSCHVQPKIILYFFERDKPESLEAGKVLDSSKGEFVVLAFVMDTNSSSAKSLAEYFNVVKYPTVVICGDTFVWPFTDGDIQGAEKACK